MTERCDLLPAAVMPDETRQGMRGENDAEVMHCGLA